MRKRGTLKNQVATPATQSVPTGAYESMIESFAPRPRWDEDQSFLIDQHKQRITLSDCRHIANTALVSGALQSKANWCVGDAWIPKHTGTQTTWASRTVDRLQPWISNPTGKGDAFNWTKCVDLACVALDRDGEVFAVKSYDENGQPIIQFLESHRIGTPYVTTETRVPNDIPIYGGMRCRSGVIRDAFGNVAGYNLLPESSFFSQITSRWNIIPASSVRHIFDPVFFSQERGIPSLASGLPDWYSQHDIVDAEKTAQRVFSKLTLLEENQTGKAEDQSDKVFEARRKNITDPSKINFQERLFSNGMIRYLKSGNNMKAFENNRPSSNWQAFMDRVTRSAFIGMGWPMEIVVDMSRVGSAGVRSINSNAQAAVRRRQDVLYPHFLDLFRWRVAVGISNGEIPFANEWMKWDFSFPPQFSIDAGYDQKIVSEQLAIGTTSMSEVVGRSARTTLDVARERAADYLISKQVSDETGVPLPYIYNIMGGLNNGQAVIQQDQSQDDSDTGNGGANA